jgi:hypothetical protein
MHSERGNSRAALVIVENTAMRELGWIGSLHVRNALLSICINIVVVRTMQVVLRKRGPPPP